MSIIDSPYYNQLMHQETIALGKLYFFEHFLIAEFNEGITINFEDFSIVRFLVKIHFGNSDFGFISNRKYSYSIDVNDASLFNKSFKNLKAYASVTYSNLASKVFEMENHFFDFNRRNFNNLEEAIDWVEDSLESQK